VNQRKSKGIIAFITKQMKHQPKAMVAGEDRQTIRERIVGQAITDAHDVLRQAGDDGLSAATHPDSLTMSG
jgi:hypothetical protein